MHSASTPWLVFWLVLSTYSAQYNSPWGKSRVISLGSRDISLGPRLREKNLVFFPLYYSYSRLLQEAWGNHIPACCLYYLQSLHLHSSYSPLPRSTPLQLEVLLHLAAQWGEGMSILVAAGAAAFLMLECLCGKETPSWSGIMILRW